jgi:hypothetical protein
LAEIDYPEDVAAIRGLLRLPDEITDEIIQDLYHEFCEKEYCAGWLVIRKPCIERFGKWLKDVKVGVLLG